MAEYHINVVEIVGTWSRELLNLMISKMSERYRRASGHHEPISSNQVSDAELFAQMGVKIQKQ